MKIALSRLKTIKDNILHHLRLLTFPKKFVCTYLWLWTDNVKCVDPERGV
jgi:hypothetical protein